MTFFLYGLLCYDVVHIYKYPVRYSYIYTLLYEEVLQVVSTMKWIQMMIYNGLHHGLYILWESVTYENATWL